MLRAIRILRTVVRLSKLLIEQRTQLCRRCSFKRSAYVAYSQMGLAETITQLIRAL
jgi:hypothetical protein